MANAGTFAYFATEDKTGVTPDYVHGFVDTFERLSDPLRGGYGQAEQHPLYERLQHVESVQPSEEQSCDQIFARYLAEVAKVVSPTCFRAVVQFVLLYRECLHRYGWLKLFQEATSAAEPEEQKTGGRYVILSSQQRTMMQTHYCAANNAEFVPIVANELVTIFAPEHVPQLPKDECVNLVINLCEWLLQHGYTCTKVSVVKE